MCPILALVAKGDDHHHLFGAVRILFRTTGHGDDSVRTNVLSFKEPLDGGVNVYVEVSQNVVLVHVWNILVLCY